MKTHRLMVLLVGATLSAASYAGDREFADIYTDCGLGALIAPNNSAVAAVTNVTWDLGTTAILSNLSSEESCEGGKDRSAAFIFDAYPSIESDIAIGDGEHLSALLEIAGVDEAQKPELKASLREELAELAAADDYSSQTRYQKAESLFDALQKSIS